ncbi:glycosyltransferase family 4 protein [Neobacillus sp. YX16]|uniref:glycosyltransferase family 4 protein n=1 Tax=Neobacillus sp. YX16 TaxID=3047874 RepID=UPI0024C3FBC7|nr:glycosyltransferase family 4 protein [Neobacillus sp. YX16]WHZ02854.1 glycosyltransferase family 4 protein [Neobacillus sp. YX16]
MKKVLLLGNHGFVIYNFRKEFVKELLKNGYEVFISLPKDDDKVPKMVDWGCKFIETNVDGRGTNPITDFKLILHYIRILIMVKPDVVLAYTIKPNLYGGVACRLLNIPCINTITGLGSGFSKKSLLKSFLAFMYKLSLKKSYTVFFQNTADMSTLLEGNIIKGNYMLIPGSGVNLKEYTFREFPNDNILTFIFIGRIMKDKGIDQYLEAAKIIKDKYPNTRFNLIGYVEKSQPHYNDKITLYEKEGYINYYGYQSNVRPFIEEAHCIIQPSHGGEGLSNVLLETAATGRVLIASNIPGCRETIEESYNGYTFAPKDTNHLVDKIEKFINLSYEDRARMGLNSRLKIEKEFDRNIVVQAYISRIKQIS